MAFRDFLVKALNSADAKDQLAAKRGREISGWIFNLMRNLLVLGALKYFSDKTGSAYVLIAYQVCSIAFMLYVLTYWQEVYLRIITLITRNVVAEIADLALNVLIGLVIMIGGFKVSSAIAEAVARAQGR